MDASLATAYGFLLVLLRTAALCSTAPIFGARVVPARIRLGVAVAISFAVYSGAGAPGLLPPPSIFGIAKAAASETAVGIFAGLAATWVLDAALAAGHLAGLSAGLGFAALVDPLTGANSTAVSETMFVLAQASAVALGLHREAIAWLARSFGIWPPGAPADLAGLAARAVEQGIFSIALSVRLAFPVIGAVLLGHLFMGLMTRMAPQIHLNNIGFSIAILAGGFALYLTAPTVAEIVARAAMAAF